MRGGVVDIEIPAVVSPAVVKMRADDEAITTGSGTMPAPTRIHILLAAALSLTLSAAAYARDIQLPAAVARIMDQLRVPNSSVSIYVHDVATDKVAAELNAEQPRSPASSIKTLTTFAALDMLGPAYTWKTRAYTRGRLANGVLHGDLYLVGGGDPYLTSERWWAFVQNIRALGLAKINGDIVIDNSYFTPIATSRADFDAQPFRSYNVIPDALMVNFQTSRFTLVPSTQGSRPMVLVNPLPANLAVKNQVRIGPGRCEGYNYGISFDTPEAEDPNTLVISGVLATACGTPAFNRAIMRAPDYAYGTFRTLWTQSGGAVDGALRVEALPPDAVLFYEYESLPLSEIIRLVNKYSNNVMARHLLLTMGAETFGAPATAEHGLDAVNAWLTRRDVAIAGFTLENGSGLSRTERITAHGLGAVLDLAWHSPFMPEFAASLPLSATDGTLRSRFSAAGMQGRIRLKTGRLDDVSALAGFVNAASGKTYVVVIIVNHPGAHAGIGEQIQTELIRWVFAQ
jgi:serine-type D-Ala-D-Ala carboxypeptidase/endopeptidase (penicillin-binding protein 4)